MKTITYKMVEVKWMCFITTMIIAISLAFISSSNAAETAGMRKGIYITQQNLENTPYLTYLIHQAKETGIDTFIIDMIRPTAKYAKNIELVHQNHIRYVARVVVFPYGGTFSQIHSSAYLEKRYRVINAAIVLGADEIQLDYIRYQSSQPASHQNAIDIYNIIKSYRDRVAAHGIPLEVDVFGITSFGESKHIGQSLPLIASAANMICPMDYPSHFEPFRIHAVTPYETILTSMHAIRRQFHDHLTFKLNPYIELSNYRYPLSNRQRLSYIYAEIRAAQDGGASGWYAWSPHNQYDNLFRVLKMYKVK